MQVRGDKLAVFGIEYFHSDTTKPNEHQLYRLDGNLTNQPPVCRYDELGEAKIVENQVRLSRRLGIFVLNISCFPIFI